MKIRKATVDDANRLSEIAIASVLPYKNTDFNAQGWEIFLSATKPVAFIQHMESDAYFTLCVLLNTCDQPNDCALLKNTIDGFITIKNHQKIDQLFVLPESQRQGIATRL